MWRASASGRWLAALPALIVLTAGAGCGVTGNATSRPADTGPSNDVWVVRHAWHTRVAVRRADVDTSVWPESRDVGDVAFLEVGWGDRDFYSTPVPSVWDAIDPVVRPTPSALHVGGFEPPPAQFLAGTVTVHLRVPAAGFQRLTRFVHDEYALDGAGQPVRIGRGYYERSWFYEARSRYHALFSNSNQWVAKALRTAGLPMDPAGAVTAAGVIAQAEAIAATR